jgi:hypothetical protein
LGGVNVEKPGRPSFGRGVLLAASAACTLLLLSCHRPVQAKVQPKGGFEIEVTDADGGPVPCRVHLRAANGEFWKASTWPSFDDHFVFPGRATFPLVSGTYTYEVERGPEYRALRGSFQVGDGAPTTLHLRLERIANLASQGWYPGDLHIHRKKEDVPLLVRAEDLSIAPVVTWWNGLAAGPAFPASRVVPLEGSRWMEATAGEDERWGGAIMYFRLDKPLDLPPSMMQDGKLAHREGDDRDEYPSPAELARIARAQPAAHIDIEKPFWWDAATWVGLGFADSIGIAHNHMTRASLHNGEAWGKARDPKVYGDGPFGDAYWSQDIYYHILDAGVRIAPSAGSASGVLPNPVGYNRVYVHLEGPLDYDAWWQGLKGGHSFVTNGPLLLVSANGELPGHVFQGNRGAKIDITLDTRVVSNEPIGSVELVRDGKVVQRGTLDHDGASVSFAPVSFKQSGWFLVRTIADRTDNFHFASTAPFYVEIKPRLRRISRASVQFFIDWIDERMAHLRSGTMAPDKLQSVLAYHQEAERFWQRQLAQANAE